MNSPVIEKGSLPIRLENITPILCVQDMIISLEFYIGILGFKEAEWGDDNFTAINRDNTGIYLCRNGQGLEMHIEDPDGHVLRLGTDPDESLPFAEYK